MPKQRNNNRSKNKRKNRNRNGNHSTVNVYRPVFSGDATRVSLKYSSDGTLKLTGLGFASVAGNAIYDPSFIGTTPPSALGWTEYSAFYSKYRVTSSSITVDFCQGSATSLTIVALNAFPGAKPTGITDMDEMRSQPYSQWRIITRDDSGTTNVRITSRLTTDRIMGRNTETSLLAAQTWASNPAETWRWVLSAQDITSNDKDVCFVYTVTYDVIMYDRLSPELTYNHTKDRRHPVVDRDDGRVELRKALSTVRSLLEGSNDEEESKEEYECVRSNPNTKKR